MESSKSLDKAYWVGYADGLMEAIHRLEAEFKLAVENIYKTNGSDDE